MVSSNFDDTSLKVKRSLLEEFWKKVCSKVNNQDIFIRNDIKAPVFVLVSAEKRQLPPELDHIVCKSSYSSDVEKMAVNFLKIEAKDAAFVRVLPNDTERLRMGQYKLRKPYIKAFSVTDYELITFKTMRLDKSSKVGRAYLQFKDESGEIHETDKKKFYS